MKTKLALAISAALISSATYANTQYSSNHAGIELLSADHHKKPAIKINNVKAPQRYIIELESPAVAKYQGGISTYASTAVKDKNSKLRPSKLHLQKPFQRLLQMLKLNVNLQHYLTVSRLLAKG